MRVLVTSGATREYIDGVRFLTNVSTGATGAALASAFAKFGHEVTLLCGEGAVAPGGSVQAGGEIKVERFRGFGDLDAKVRAHLGLSRCDLVFHAAAVSDYSVEEILVGGGSMQAGSEGKIDSREGDGFIELRLRPNFKIVERIKQYAGEKSPVVVAFKLTNTFSSEERLRAVELLTNTQGVDWVVHNDLSEILRGEHHFRLFDQNELKDECVGAEALAELLERRVIRSEKR